MNTKFNLVVAVVFLFSSLSVSQVSAQDDQLMKEFKLSFYGIETPAAPVDTDAIVSAINRHTKAETGKLSAQISRLEQIVLARTQPEELPAPEPEPIPPTESQVPLPVAASTEPPVHQRYIIRTYRYYLPWGYYRCR